jgi:hypothetical protein
MTQHLKKLFAVAALLALLCPATLLAQTASTDDKIQALEAEIQKLSAEVAALKQQATPTAAPGAAAAAAVPSDSTAPAAKPSPLAGIASVLGGATVNGLVDGYYDYNANSPSDHSFTQNRFFDGHSNQFALNLVELGIQKTPDADSRLGYDLTFGFGPAMTAVNGVDGVTSWSQYIKEGYLSYLAPVGKGLQIDFGKFVTPMGAEVIESNANWNYSRSLLFYYAVPYYHFGARAKYTFNDKYALSAYVVNGWNDITHDVTTGYSNSGKTGGLSFAWTPNKKWSVTETWLGGPGAVPQDGDNWRNVFDTVVAYTVSPKLSLQMNGDYGRVEDAFVKNAATWYGVAGYAKYQFNPLYAVATRYEYFGDPDSYTTGLLAVPTFGKGQDLQEVTATFERKIATHMISRLEYRYDTSNAPFFPKGTDKLVNNQNTVTAGVIFVLEPSETK